MVFSVFFLLFVVFAFYYFCCCAIIGEQAKREIKRETEKKEREEKREQMRMQWERERKEREEKERKLREQERKEREIERQKQLEKARIEREKFEQKIREYEKKEQEEQRERIERMRLCEAMLNELRREEMERRALVTAIVKILRFEVERRTGLPEIDKMEGHQFEYYCAGLLRKLGFSNVEVTKGSGDQGVDIIAIKDSIRYAIQCKRYSSALGNSPVQEVNAGKQLYHCHVAVVLTNRYFTAGAKQLAAANGVLLWDRNKLEEMIKQADSIPH